MESTFRFNPDRIKFEKFVEFDDFNFLGSHNHEHQIALFNKKTNHLIVFDTWHFSTLTKLKLNDNYSIISRATFFDKTTLLWQFESLEYRSYLAEKLCEEQIPNRVFLHTDRGLLICDLYAKAIKSVFSNEYAFTEVTTVLPLSKSNIVAGTINGELIYYDIDSHKLLRVISQAHSSPIKHLIARLTSFDSQPLIYSTDDTGFTKCWNYSDSPDPFIAFDTPHYQVM